MAAGFRFRLAEERGRRPALAAGLDVDGGPERAGGWLFAARSVGPLDLGLGFAFGPYRGGRLTEGTDHTVSPIGSVALPLFDGKLSLEAALPPGGIGRDGIIGDRLPVDLGLSIRPWPWLSMGIGRLGEGVWAGRVTLRPTAIPLAANPGNPPPIFDRASTRRTIDPAQAPRHPARIEEEALRVLRQMDLGVEAVRIDGTLATVWIAPAPEEPAARAIGRAARALTGAVPNAVRRFRIVMGRGGIDTARIDLWRHELEATARHAGSTAELWHGGSIRPPAPEAPPAFGRSADPPLTFSLRSLLEVAIDDAEAAVGYRATVTGGAEWRPRPGWIAGGAVTLTPRQDVPEASILRSFYTDLPPMRSDLAASRRRPVRLDRLWLARLWQPEPGVVFRGLSGWIDPDLAGTSLGVVWQPFAARWAIEAEVTAGLRRNADSHLDILPEPRASALVDLHWQPSVPGLDLRLGGGRYLAGDWGMEAGLTRRFDNGISLGLTGALSFGRPPMFRASLLEPAAQVGLTVSIPLQRSVPHEWRHQVSVRQDLRLGSLLRDANARPDLPFDLSDMLFPVGYRAIADTWPQLLD